MTDHLGFIFLHTRDLGIKMQIFGFLVSMIDIQATTNPYAKKCADMVLEQMVINKFIHYLGQTDQIISQHKEDFYETSGYICELMFTALNKSKEPDMVNRMAQGKILTKIVIIYNNAPNFVKISIVKLFRL